MLPKSSKPPKNKDGVMLKVMLKNTPKNFQAKSTEKYIVTMEATTSKKGRVAVASKIKRMPLRPNDKPPTHKCFVIGLENTGPLSKQKCFVSCDCDNFMYYWEYALTQHGASKIKFSNGDAPHTTNPHLVPGVCSHLWLLISKIIQKGK